MSRIEVFADVVCPFTHVGLRRFVVARDGARSKTRLRVRAWPLEWINGVPLSPDHAAREIEDLRAQVAPDLFTGFDSSTFPHTSIPAFGLAAAAYAIDDLTGEAVSIALRDSLFEHGLDISDAAVLRSIAKQFGIDRLDAELLRGRGCARRLGARHSTRRSGLASFFLGFARLVLSEPRDPPGGPPPGDPRRRGIGRLLRRGAWLNALATRPSIAGPMGGRWLSPRGLWALDRRSRRAQC